jgi:hypothetical protein
MEKFGSGINIPDPQHCIHMGGFTKELSRLKMLFAIEPIQYNATQLKMTAGREATQLYI